MKVLLPYWNTCDFHYFRVRAALRTEIPCITAQRSSQLASITNPADTRIDSERDCRWGRMVARAVTFTRRSCSSSRMRSAAYST